MATVFGGCMTMVVVAMSWAKTRDLFGVDITKGDDQTG